MLSHKVPPAFVIRMHVKYACITCLRKIKLEGAPASICAVQPLFFRISSARSTLDVHKWISPQMRNSQIQLFNIPTLVLFFAFPTMQPASIPIKHINKSHFGRTIHYGPLLRDLHTLRCVSFHL